MLRRRFGYVIQSTGLFPHWTVAENIATVPWLLGWPRKRIEARVDELMNLLGLPPEEFRDRYRHQLSGGQQQRVGVARALAADPYCLIMDEPFGALDAVTRNALQGEMARIHKATGKTVLMVTHDVDEAIRLAERIVVMDQGKLVQVATPEEILLSPATPFVEALFGGESASLRLLKVRHVADFVLHDGGTPSESIGPEETLETALARMLAKGVSSLAVTNGAGPIGVIRARRHRAETAVSAETAAQRGAERGRSSSSSCSPSWWLPCRFSGPFFHWAFPALARPVYQRASFAALTLSHVGLVAGASLVVVVAGVAIGIGVTRAAGQEFAGIVGTVTAIGQTFPPVAVLAIAVPLIGFGAAPTVIALIAYGVLPVLDNTVAGLRSVSAAAKDASDGMGFTARQKLLFVELPLAAPVIAAGIRTSVTISIGTATIGSTVGALHPRLADHRGPLRLEHRLRHPGRDPRRPPRHRGRPALRLARPVAPPPRDRARVATAAHCCKTPVGGNGGRGKQEDAAAPSPPPVGAATHVTAELRCRTLPEGDGTTASPQGSLPLKGWSRMGDASKRGSARTLLAAS